MPTGAHFGVRLEFLVAPGRVPLLWCLIAFILTFFVTRTITRYIRATADRTGPRKWWQPHNISVSQKPDPGPGGDSGNGGSGNGDSGNGDSGSGDSGSGGGLHIHHAVFGVILVLVSGLAMVTMASEGTNGEFTAAAIFFGIGAALVLDEFALILHLQDVYWSEDGRTSVDAVFAAAAVAGLMVLGFNPLSMFEVDGWQAADSAPAKASVALLAVLNLALAVVVLLKGKLWTGLLGMFFTPLLVVGAIRLARPHSPWARWHYQDKPGKMHRSLERERYLRRPFVQADLWLQHVLAGEPRFPDDDEVNAELDKRIHAAPAPGTASKAQSPAPAACPAVGR